ncbi:hypothetical protein [Halomonas sp. E19]|uniref:hypothetical protein n=1 Tax=Halomonas sp. E19 TaxID=3397247 RepID=UPI0040345722
MLAIFSLAASTLLVTAPVVHIPVVTAMAASRPALLRVEARSGAVTGNPLVALRGTMHVLLRIKPLDPKPIGARFDGADLRFIGHRARLARLEERVLAEGGRRGP